MRYLGLILVFIHLGYSGTFISKIKSNQISDDISDFMSEFSKFADYPLHWCSITPTPEYVVDSIYYVDSIEVDIGFNVVCDETVSKYEFRQFINKYQRYMDTHESVIDSAITSKYPDLRLYWSDLTHGVGHDINGDTVSYIAMNIGYGASLSNDNKGIFFTLHVNNFTTNPLRATFIGKMLELRGSSIYKGTFWFHVNIPKKSVSNVSELVFELNHVWHTTKNQKFISSYREDH